MVVEEKRIKDEIRICVDLKKLHDACVHDPFPTSFIDEVLDSIGGQEAYSFTNGFSGYHQIKITPEDRSKTTFVTEWGCFQHTAGGGELDHPITFASRRLSKAEGRICRWLLLFQEYDFEVIVKLGRLNARPDHLSHIEIGEEPTNLEEVLLDVQLITVHIVNGHFEDIIHFLTIETDLEGYTIQQKELVVRATYFSVIAGHLYKMGSDEILRRYVPEFERRSILMGAHGGATGAHYAGRATTQKILHAGFWWTTLHQDSQAYCKAHDVCQRTSRPS
eukprot:PITA_26186